MDTNTHRTATKPAPLTCVRGPFDDGLIYCETHRFWMQDNAAYCETPVTIEVRALRAVLSMEPENLSANLTGNEIHEYTGYNNALREVAAVIAEALAP